MAKEGSTRGSGWLDSALLAPEKLSISVSCFVIASGLAVAWLITVLAGGASKVAPHWFYIPIIFAAVRFGVWGALLAALAAALIGGPILPADTRSGEAQPASDWLTRGSFFLLIGLVMAGLIGRSRKALAAQARLAEKERELAEQRAAVLQNVSHELRTPLTIITGVAKTLQRKSLTPDESKLLVDGLVQASERLEELVKMILSAAGSNDRRMEARSRADLESLLKNVVESINRVGASDRVIWSLQPGARSISTNLSLLDMALRCVVDNALKFSPPDSQVEVTTSKSESLVNIRVADQGPGIPPAFRSLAFDAFTQADPSTTRQHGGLGLGLFVARQLIEQLGGKLQLEEAEVGTRVLITIPQRRTEERVK